MLITIRATVPLSEDTLAVARTHAAFALHRFGHRIRSVRVRIADVNGPRGGVDKTCTVTIRLTLERDPIVVEDADADARAAVGRALDRSARVVARSIRRRRRVREGDPIPLFA